MHDNGPFGSNTDVVVAEVMHLLGGQEFELVSGLHRNGAHVWCTISAIWGDNDTADVMILVQPRGFSNADLSRIRFSLELVQENVEAPSIVHIRMLDRKGRSIIPNIRAERCRLILHDQIPLETQEGHKADIVPIEPSKRPKSTDQNAATLGRSPRPAMHRSGAFPKAQSSKQDPAERRPASLCEVDIETGAVLKEFPGSYGAISALWPLPDNKQIVFAAADNWLRVYQIDRGTTSHTLAGHSGTVNCLTGDPNGKFFFAGSDDHTVSMWACNDLRLVQRYYGHMYRISALAASGDGLLLSGGSDGSLLLWNIVNGKFQQRLSGHDAEITSIAIAGSGGIAVTGSSDGTLKIWHTRQGEEVATVSIPYTRINSVVLTPDLSRFIVAANNSFHIGEIESGRIVHKLDGHYAQVTCIALSPDGQTLLSGARDRTLRVWDLDSGMCTMNREINQVPCAVGSFTGGTRVVLGIDVV